MDNVLRGFGVVLMIIVTEKRKRKKEKMRKNIWERKERNSDLINISSA